jgi:hypothetical protein
METFLRITKHRIQNVKNMMKQNSQRSVAVVVVVHKEYVERVITH